MERVEEDGVVGDGSSWRAGNGVGKEKWFQALVLYLYGVSGLVLGDGNDNI